VLDSASVKSEAESMPSSSKIIESPLATLSQNRIDPEVLSSEPATSTATAQPGIPESNVDPTSWVMVSSEGNSYTTSPDLEPSSPTTTSTVFPSSTSTYISVSASSTHSLAVPDEDEEVTHSIPDTPVEDDEIAEDDSSEDPFGEEWETPEAELVSSGPKTFTKFLVSTISLGPVRVTRTRSAESKVSSAEPLRTTTTEVMARPTVTPLSPVPEVSSSQGVYGTDNAIDATPKEPAVLTLTLFVASALPEPTQTVPCAQLGRSCESMVVVFSPLAPPVASSQESTPIVKRSYNPEDGARYATGGHSNHSAAASASFFSLWLALLVSHFAGILVMV